MKHLSIFLLIISLFSVTSITAQDEDSCNAFTTKKQCHKEGKSKCTWLESKEICKSKAAIASEKEANEKNLKRKKRGGED